MKLKEYRAKSKLTQAALAQQINNRTNGEPISQSMIDRWEKGTIPRQENMRRVMEATDHHVTFADFYGETGEAPKRKPRSQDVSVAASRRAAATVRRRREVAP